MATVDQIPTTRPQISKRARLDESRWYAIQILPNLQKTAHYNLTRQDFQCFFPQIKTRITRYQYQHDPLFKGYGFVYFDPATNPHWKSIQSTKGVIAIVPKFQLIPTPMPRGFIEFLIENDPITESQYDDHLDHFYPGLRVRVNQQDHLFHNKEGVVVSDRGRSLEISFLWQLNLNRNIIVAKHSVTPIPTSNQE